MTISPPFPAQRKQDTTHKRFNGRVSGGGGAHAQDTVLVLERSTRKRSNHKSVIKETSEI